MSSVFELHERIRRLRQMLGYFKSAAILTGAEVRNAAQDGQGEQAHQEWMKLIEDIGDCLATAQSGAQAPAADADFKMTLGDAGGRVPEETLH
jgi:hypothetical protein